MVPGADLDPRQTPRAPLRSNGAMRNPNLFIAYAPRGAGLAAGELNLRFERAVLRHLAKRWPLEYRVDLQEALA
jgi:hypothetical protein